ncbi:MAG: phage holin family protein [Geminicoccaceae bacterium]
MATNIDNRSVGELLRDLAQDVTRLIRNELALARSEASDKVHATVRAMTGMLVGAFMLLAALIVLMQALVMGLSNTMPDWAAASLVGGVVAVLGVILVYVGQSRLSATQLTPERTAHNLRKDINLAKEQVT